jgi:hypothetical protein
MISKKNEKRAAATRSEAPETRTDEDRPRLQIREKSPPNAPPADTNATNRAGRERCHKGYETRETRGEAAVGERRLEAFSVLIPRWDFTIARR